MQEFYIKGEVCPTFFLPIGSFRFFFGQIFGRIFGHFVFGDGTGNEPRVSALQELLHPLRVPGALNRNEQNVLTRLHEAKKNCRSVSRPNERPREEGVSWCC
jgi:hypothetical protein